MLVRDGWYPKVGDIVRIREWDDMADEFDVNSVGDIECEFTFIKDMRKLCGLEFEITEIDEHKVYGHHSSYSISFDMIESVEDRNDLELNDDELLMFLDMLTK